MTALTISNLTVERGGRAVVRDVTVQIPPGALLGPNGAGKSTLVLAVGGVIKPAVGQVLLDAPGRKAGELTGRRPELIRQAGVASHAHVMEGGRIRHSGPAADLRANPELLQSAYLLRGSPDHPTAVPPPPAVRPD